MAVTTQRQNQTQIVTTVQRRQQSRRTTSAPQQTERQKSRQKAGSMVVPSLKASLVGGFGLLILLLIGLIPPPENLPFVSLAFLVLPGFLVVCLATGLLAGIFAGDNVKNSYQGGQVGWMAGFWSGIFGGIVAMLLAAFGLLMTNVGLGLVNQFSPEQLQSAIVSADTIALAGRVFGALIVYGVLGSVIAGLFSSIGGMIYPKLSHSNS